MKKATIILAIIITILSINKQESIKIPKEAIRFRVIANSNDKKDQDLKKKVVKDLQKNIATIKYTPKDLTSSRENIKNSIPKFDETIKNTLQKEGISETYSINYGMNYFPEKNYQGVIYEAGDYESLVITLGNGLGENFWCVLFPPLCLIDQEKQEENVEYTSFIKEIIAKYF